MDGWYWGFFFDVAGNPPLLTRSAAIPGLLPEHPTEPSTTWLPTGDQFGGGAGDALYPYSGFGNYCINCHASAERESTFSALANLIGKELTYKYLGNSQQLLFIKRPALAAQFESIHDRLSRVSTPELERVAFAHERLLQAVAPKLAAEAAAAAAAGPSDAGTPSTPNPFPPALTAVDRAFLATFPQLKDVPFTNVWERRFPAETFDHVSAEPGKDGPGQFVTSDQCVGCHDATINNASTPNMVFQTPDAGTLNLSPYAEWRASPMGLAGRDPIFFSQLESELNQVGREPKVKGQGDCVESLCLHCHGVMGQRQLALDTGGKGPTSGLCPDFLPKDQRPDKQTGQLFTRNVVNAWPEPGGRGWRFRRSTGGSPATASPARPAITSRRRIRPSPTPSPAASRRTPRES